jgi:gentisate 1,2-dioxygenase
MSVTPQDFAAASNMQELYDLLAKCDVQNGWNKPEPSLWPLPTIDFKPASWSYVQARAALDAAGRFVNTELAERRNLILANPTVPGNKYPTVKTLVAAYQMVKAGEQARSHFLDLRGVLEVHVLLLCRVVVWRKIRRKSGR